MFYIVRHYWRLLLVQCISMMVVITVKATRILTTLAGISCIGFENDKKMTNTLLRKANLTPLCDVGPCPPMTINIAFIIYHSENSSILHLSYVRMVVPQQEKNYFGLSEKSGNFTFTSSVGSGRLLPIHLSQSIQYVLHEKYPSFTRVMSQLSSYLQFYLQHNFVEPRGLFRFVIVTYGENP